MSSPRRLSLVAALVVLTAAGALVAVVATSLTSSDAPDATAVGEAVTGDERSGPSVESELRTAAVASCGRTANLGLQELGK